MPCFAKIRTIASLLLALSVLLIGCVGCFGEESTFIDPSPKGVRIIALSNSQIAIGGTLTMTVQYYATTFTEVGRSVEATVYFSGNGTGGVLDRRNVTLPAVSQVVTVQYVVALPEGSTAGNYTLFASRAAGSSDATIVPDQRAISVIANNGVTASFIPALVSGDRGSSVQTQLVLQPSAGFTGTVALSPRVPELTLSQNSVTFTGASLDPVFVNATYAIPANALGESTVVVLDYLVPGHPVRSTSFVVGYNDLPEPTFSLTVSPDVVHVSGNQVRDDVVVTIQASSGWRGDVSVSLALPGQGSLTVDDPTNPFVVNVNSDQPQARTVRLRYTPGQGGAPIGTATVTATSGATSHSDTFQVTAS